MPHPRQDERPIDTEPSLFESLWRHKWLIAGAAIVAIIIGYGLSAMQPPVYQASGQVLLTDPRGAGVYSDPFTAYLDRGRYVRNEAEVFKSLPVATLASEMLGGDPSPEEIQSVVTANGEYEFDVLTIGATQPTAAGAVDVVNAVVAAYEVVVAAESEATSAEATAALEQSKLDLQVRVAETEAALAEHPESTALEAQRNAQLDQLRSLDAQIEQIAVSSALYGSGVRLYDAPRGAALIAPKPLRNAAIAGVLAIIGAGAWAWWREERNDAIADRNTPAAVLDAPLLGVVPDFSSVGVDGPAPTITNPSSVASEAYHFIVSSLQLALDHIEGTTLVVTSAAPSDGKSVTALNLAIAAADTGRTPLLIDADERQRGLSDFARLSTAPGLTDVSVDGDNVDSLIRHVDVGGDTQLRFVPAGSVTTTDTARFFRSSAFKKAMPKLTAGQDLVIIDTPPVLSVSDTTDITLHADAVLMIVQPGTSMQRLDEARMRVDMTGKPIIGYVYNRAGDSTKYPAYGYGRTTD